MKNYVQKNKLNITYWHAQILDLNPTENMWGELKAKVHARRPANLEELDSFSKEESARIS